MSVVVSNNNYSFYFFKDYSTFLVDCNTFRWGLRNRKSIFFSCLYRSTKQIHVYNKMRSSLRTLKGPFY